MKKIALTILMALGVTTMAQARSTMFVQLDLGAGVNSLEDGFDVIGSDTKFIWRPTLGLEFGENNVHSIGIDYTKWYDETETVFDTTSSLELYTVGLKYAYRFNSDTFKFLGNFRALVGGRLNISKISYSYAESYTPIPYSDSSTKIGVGAFIGAEYPIMNNFYVGANVEANYIGSIANVSYATYGITGYVKYAF